MKFKFIWSTPSSGAPIVSIASYGLTFNASAIELLKKPEKVLLGFDQTAKVIGVKPVTAEDEAEGTKGFTFAKRERSGYIRISNKDFIQYVSNKVGIDLTKTTRFSADWDEDEQVLIIDITKPIDGGSAELENEDVE